MYSIIVTALLCLSHFANGVTVTNCDSQVGTVNRVTISNCDVNGSRSPCILQRGGYVTLDINFTPNNDVTELKSIVYGIITEVPIPFPLPNTDVCADPNSEITCPLQKDEDYDYNIMLAVHPIYPQVSLTVQWKLQDQDGNDVVCILIPVKIQ